MERSGDVFPTRTLPRDCGATRGKRAVMVEASTAANASIEKPPARFTSMPPGIMPAV